MRRPLARRINQARTKAITTTTAMSSQGTLPSARAVNKASKPTTYKMVNGSMHNQEKKT